MKKEKQESKGITISKEKDTAEWYSQVCLKSGLADYGPVKGTFIIKPYGYKIWEKIQDYFNSRLKKLNIPNAYFPLFIPESFFKKEAEHAEGFSPEVAWLEKKPGEGEKIALRPTSETIIYDSYSKWIRSWRDLPFKLNQWCNIVRWEVSDTKLFLRSREFLWQEGHCVYETEEECEKETLIILNEYEKLCEDLLAVPVLKGQKTQKEKFAGALRTYAIEAFMPDGKALQCGTSHNLGQTFGKAFNIQYKDKQEKDKFPWQNSWGVSTRLIGSLIMTHSDNKGLVLPPSIAPIKIAIIPILFDKTKNKILKKAEEIKKQLKNYETILDLDEDKTPGYKFSEYELKGIPLRLEIGPKDLEKNSITLVTRHDLKKQQIKIKDLDKTIKTSLKKMQKDLLNKAEKFLKNNIKPAKNWQEFEKIIKNKQIALAPFCGNIECEDYIKDKTQGAGSRIIKQKSSGKCIQCGKPATALVYFSKNY